MGYWDFKKDISRLEKEYRRETTKTVLGCLWVVFYTTVSFTGLFLLMHKCDPTKTPLYQNEQPKKEEAIKKVDYLKSRADMYKKLYAYNTKGERND